MLSSEQNRNSFFQTSQWKDCLPRFAYNRLIQGNKLEHISNFIGLLAHFARIFNNMVALLLMCIKGEIEMLVMYNNVPIYRFQNLKRWVCIIVVWKYEKLSTFLTMLPHLYTLIRNRSNHTLKHCITQNTNIFTFHPHIAHKGLYHTTPPRYGHRCEIVFKTLRLYLAHKGALKGHLAFQKF